MARAKEWKECQRDRDWHAVAARKGYKSRTGGNHGCIVVNGRSIAIPNGETRKGTKAAILRSLAAAGALAFIGLMVFAALAAT